MFFSGRPSVRRGGNGRSGPAGDDDRRTKVLSEYGERGARRSRGSTFAGNVRSVAPRVALLKGGVRMIEGTAATVIAAGLLVLFAGLATIVIVAGIMNMTDGKGVNDGEG